MPGPRVSGGEAPAGLYATMAGVERKVPAIVQQASAHRGFIFLRGLTWSTPLHNTLQMNNRAPRLLTEIVPASFLTRQPRNPHFPLGLLAVDGHRKRPSLCLMSFGLLSTPRDLMLSSVFSIPQMECLRLGLKGWGSVSISDWTLASCPELL